MGKVIMGLFKTNLHFLLLSKLSRSLALPTVSDPKHETKVYFHFYYQEVCEDNEYNFT